jgi:uncharacterized protein
MDLIFEISILVILVIFQSIFGVGLLLFGTPSFLLLGYDFVNTINILMPVSVLISLIQFFRTKIQDKNFIIQYNIYCLPFLILFLVLALKLRELIDFKFYVALLLIFSSVLILNKQKIYPFKEFFLNLKKLF